MSFNTLSIAAELGISRVALASSVNSIGMGKLKAPSLCSRVCLEADMYLSLLKETHIRLSSSGREAPLPSRGCVFSVKIVRFQIDENQADHLLLASARYSLTPLFDDIRG